jgi:AcrR family transcriptional regulator
MTTTADDGGRQTKRSREKSNPQQARKITRPAIDFEAAFDKFVADMLPIPEGTQLGGPDTSTQAKSRAPRRSISTEVIYERALLLLDEEGPRALTLRRLASELKISTRTLYKRVHNRDKMLRVTVDLHFARLKLDFEKGGSWEASAWNWCSMLHRALSGHPHLTALMSDADAAALDGFVADLIATTVQEGMSRQVAIDCCRALTSVTVSDAMRNVRTSKYAAVKQNASSTEEFPQEFQDTVRLILKGVRAESSAAIGRRSDGTFD